MLFKIKSVTTVQLKAYDFHKRYKEAVRAMINQELQDKLSIKYGKVIDVTIEDNNIQDNPLLLTHEGIALFKVQFEAIVEQVVEGEVTMALLENIVEQNESCFELQFQVGCIQAVDYIPMDVYERKDIENKIKVKQEIVDFYGNNGITGEIEFVVGKFYNVQMASFKDCRTIGVIENPENDNSSSDNDSVENNQNSDQQDDDNSNNDDL